MFFIFELIWTFICLVIKGIGWFLWFLIFRTIWLDCFACGVTLTLLCCLMWGVNWALAIVIGIALIVGLLFLTRTTVGYWILAVPMSLVWGAVFGCIGAMIASGTEACITVMFTTFGIASGLIILIHKLNRSWGIVE